MQLTKDALLARIREEAHHPATARDLLRLLGIPRTDRAVFRTLLKRLVAAGELVKVRGTRYGLPDKMDLVVGRLHTHPGGFGFVVPEVTEPGAARAPDIYVAAPNLTDALHDDRVVARIERHTEKGPEGRIVRVLERGHPTVVGRFDVDAGGLAYVVPFDRRMLADVRIPTGQAASAEPGEMVVVEVTQWPTASRGPAGRVREVHRDHHPQVRAAGRPSAGGRCRGHAARGRREGARRRGADRLPARHDGHDRR
jgi:ribonuclease R